MKKSKLIKDLQKHTKKLKNKIALNNSKNIILTEEINVKNDSDSKVVLKEDLESKPISKINNIKSNIQLNTFTNLFKLLKSIRVSVGNDKKLVFNKIKNLPTRINTGFFPSRFNKKIKKFIIFILVFLLILSLFIVSSTSLIFLRYRQTCQYSNLLDNNQVTTTNKVDNYCPNVLDQKQWGKIISNALNKNILSNFKVNSSTTLVNVSSNTSCDSVTDATCWLKQLKGELKQTNGFTNVLLIGSDNRGNELIGNTDSIMVLSFDNVSGKVIMISFPRDLFVRFKNQYGNSEYNRINALYAFYGKQTLQSTIELIIGRPIHYYAYLNFETFTKIVDQLGGIDIHLDKPFLDAYPRGETQKTGHKCNTADFDPYDFCIFSFSVGDHHFNSFDALVYSRSRELSTDWDRAGRQQEIIKAIVKNALSKDQSIQDKFNTYINLYNSIKSGVDTNVTNEDIGAMFKYVDKLSDEPVRIVLDPRLENGKFVYEYGQLDGFGDVSKFNDYSYKSVQNYLESIWNNLAYYTERPRILILNESKHEIIKGSTLSSFISSNNQYATIQQIQNNLNIKGLRIYDFTNGSKKGTLNEVVKKLPDALLYNPIIDNVTKSSFNEDILIVYGS